MSVSDNEIIAGLGMVLSAILGYFGMDIFKRVRELEKANADAVASRAGIHKDIEHIKTTTDGMTDILKLVLEKIPDGK